MPERVAIYPGSFDPLTLGHEDVARRALTVADRLIIAIAHTPTEQKRGMFSILERLMMIREVFAGNDRVEATDFRGLLVDFARERGATLIVRGLRNGSDFEYESRLALMNRALHPAAETLFLLPGPDFSFISASLVREVTLLGGDVSGFVSAPVLERLRERVRAGP